MDNYDGQGKTQQQETDDSLTMLCVVLVWVVFCLAIGLAWGVTS